MDEIDKKCVGVASKVAELVKTCPRFGRDEEYDWCNANCGLCSFCDVVCASQDVSKIE